MSATSFEQIKLFMRGLSGVISKAFSTAHNAKETAEKANANAANKMDAENPVGTGSFSLNRKSGTTVGGNSFAVGSGCTASGNASLAEGSVCTASGFAAHAEGVETFAIGGYSHAEGRFTHAIGRESHAEGWATIAHEGQHVQGRYNIEDDSKNPKYAHIVGNGYGNGSFDTNNYTQSNAHTLDWDGNAWFAGDVYVGGTNQDEGKKLMTADTMPVATADTLGGVKVGDGLTVDAEGVLGVVAEPEMVLIEQITVGDDVNTIERDKEPDGTAYNFSAVTIRAKFPPSDKTGNLSIYFGFKWPAEIRNYMINPYNATQERNGYSKCYLSNKRWRGGWWSCTLGAGDFAQYYENPVQQEQYGVEDGYISKVKLVHANGIEAGSIVEIWGVRA